jgi:signal transduction histidine kinase/ligand-binding sensor domain-containing protein
MQKGSSLTSGAIIKHRGFKPGMLFVFLLRALALLPMCFDASAEQKTLQFKHLSVDDGLSSSIVVSIMQDYKGFMWFGTYDGLNRYDGKNVVVYKNNPSDSTSLGSNHVATIFEDSEKNLFLGTLGGLSRYDRDLDRFTNNKYDTSSALYDPSFIINKIVGDKIGNLWMSTNRGLLCLKKNENKPIRFLIDSEAPNVSSSNYLESAYIDGKGSLWVATRTGLYLFHPESGKFDHIVRCKTHGENIGNFTFLQIIEDREGTIWFGSTEGLFCLKKEHETHPEIELTHLKNDPLDPRSLSNNYVRTFFIDDEGKLWIGTENGGINCFNKDSASFTHYGIDDFNPMSLNNESIHAIFQDRNKNLWVGTFGGGANVSVKNSDFIIHHKKIPRVEQSLSHNIVSYFLEDHLNRKWVATDGGGFNLFDEKTNRFMRYNSENISLKSNAILCMVEDEQGRIWMGTWASGLVRFNYSTNEIVAFTTKNSGIPDNNIYSVAKDPKGDLWLGSERHGLIRYFIKENTFVSYSQENSRNAVIKIDQKGHVYVGGTTSLQIFIPEEKRFVTYAHVLNDSTSISNDWIYSINIENDTTVWVGTKNGLNRFNPLKGTFKRYFVKDGLPDNAIKGITVDKGGAVWLSTNAGICRFDYHGNTYKNFTVSDGLQGNEFYERSILTTADGTILAGGLNGFNQIFPGKFSENKTIPAVVITDLYLFNKKVKIGEEGGALKKQISQIKTLTLSYKQSVLTFYFSVMDFTNPQKNQYAYKMENFDKEWTYCGTRNNATYTNLNPGRYRFHVKGSNNDGIWNEAGTTLDITITPPWWKTKTAMISFIVFGFSLLLGFYYYRINSLNRQKEALKKLVIERTSEIKEKNEILENKNKLLEEQNTLLEQRRKCIDEQAKVLSVSNQKLVLLNATKDKFFSIIAHDLKNPFTSVLGFCDILSRHYDGMDDTKRKQSIGVIFEASKRIFQLLENLLQWARSQTGSIKFEPREFILNEVAETNILLVNALVSKKKLEIRKNIEKEIRVFADKNMIDTAIRNLLTNAIKFTEYGFISIEIVQNADTTEVKITDTGVGISKEKMDKLFDVGGIQSTSGTRGELGTGLGLVICKEFIEKNGGVISVSSEQGKGSTFSFSIPMPPQKSRR